LGDVVREVAHDGAVDVGRGRRGKVGGERGEVGRERRERAKEGGREVRRFGGGQGVPAARKEKRRWEREREREISVYFLFFYFIVRSLKLVSAEVDHDER
jgi:hypothetical protein